MSYLFRQPLPQPQILLPKRPHTHPPELPPISRLVRPIDEGVHVLVGIAVGVPSFHVVVHMRERPRHFVVIVPISHERDERLRRLVIREVIHALEPVLRGVVGLRGAAIVFADVLRLVVYLPVPAIGGYSEKHLLRIHDLGRIALFE